jgi:ADYC domain
VAQHLPARPGRTPGRLSVIRRVYRRHALFQKPGRLLITCTGDAEGKCVRFGYKPWGHAADGTPLAPYYQACVRLVRADYCGDGVGHTRNGMPIDIFDRIGVQRDEPGPHMSLEAA